MTHNTRKIAIKTVDIDERIIPVVNWLNSFDDVITLFSCEGNIDTKTNEHPYVVFLCFDNIVLSKVIDKTSWCSNIEVDYFNGHLRYCLRFHDCSGLGDFCSSLRKETIKEA